MGARRITEALYHSVANDARHECGYCRVPQKALPYRLELEHLQPTSRGGTDERDNLWLSCHVCNKLRSNRVDGVDPLTQEMTRLFNPRRDVWEDHFRWEHEGVFIVGRTAIGRTTVAVLQLNDSYHQSARSVWILAGIYPAGSAKPN